MTKYKILILTFVCFILGSIEAFAMQLSPGNPPSFRENSQVEVEEPSSVIVVTANNNNESFDCGFSNSDSCINEDFYPFLTIKSDFTMDSLSNIRMLNYLKQLLPVYNKMDDLNIDMIEVL